MSNYHPTYVEKAMTKSLGPNWIKHFDLVVCNSRSPLFWTAEGPFYRRNKAGQTKKVPTGKEILKLDKTEKFLLEGNAHSLTYYVINKLDKEDPRILLLSSHMFRGIRACTTFEKTLRQL